MCLIIDADHYVAYVDDNNADMKPLRKWVERSPQRIVYSYTKKLKAELENVPDMYAKMTEYRESGIANLLEIRKVVAKEAHLKKNYRQMGLKSNDLHILALAMEGNVKLLVTGDTKLMVDFKSKETVKGKIYTNAKQTQLLNRKTCP